MSVLDTFYILFDSDASKLDKGLGETEKKTDRLTGKIGAVDVAAGKMGGSLLRSMAGLAGTVVAAVSLAAITRGVMAATDKADMLAKSAKAANASIEDFTAWSDLIKKSGGSADGFAASLGNLNQQLAQIDVTGKSRAAPFLKELGIDLDLAANKGRSAMDFLPQLADAFQGLDSAKAVGIGRRLGLDQATIMTLQSGRREVEAMIAREKELGTVTKQQAEIAEKFNDTIDDTAHAFRSIWLGVAEYVLPPLTWMMEKMQTAAIFMRKHSDFIVGLMIAIGAAITFYALPPLVSMAAAAVVAFAPFIGAGVLVAALAAGFALLYDDVMNFVEGGDSMIGQILTRWPMIGQVAAGIADAIKSMLEVAKWVFGVLSDLVGLSIDGWRALFQIVGDTAPFQAAGNIISTMLTSLTEAFSAFGDLAGGVWDVVVSKIQTAVEWIGKAIELVKQVGGAISGGLGGARADIKAAQGHLSAASGSPLVAQTSNSISNRGGSRTTSVTVGKVEVKTAATDADGISRAIGGSMQAQMRQAANNFDDGVLA